ncbi:major facilitator superfamily transporter [Nocardia nova SH22a]|uniref:Major facilitator superfamily transporter n=1 Tax=Nocardia nova SH22a TaxID=1415166 RepID=W5TQR5_9NOCA|nr:MFS transporter [Nocardia nova]AHH21459.1 major facilitator superfamily transporter [Nocardia nova SH22a]
MTETSPVTARIGRPAVGALGILALAAGTLQSVVDPALPLLQRELGIGPGAGALVSIMMLITGAVITPIAGTLGDRYGGKRVLVRVMTVVAVGGSISGLAPNLPVLLLGQVLQGAMIGALPLSFILVRKYLPQGASQVAIGVVAGLFVGGGLVGMLMAGPVAHALSWHWMFVLPTLVMALATLVVHRLVPHDPPHRSDAGIDWLGMALFGAALVALMVGLEIASGAGTSLPVIALVVVVVVMLGIGWVTVERTTTAPMVDLRMLAMPAMWRACALTFLISVGSAAAIFLVPQLFGTDAGTYGFGADTTEIGRFLMPAAIAGTVAGPIAGVATRRFGARAVVFAGIAVAGGALIALGLLHDTLWHVIVAKALVSLAAGAGTTALLAGTATAVDQGDTGIATSLLMVTRVIGTAVGVQVNGAILTASTPPGSDHPAESAFVTGFIAAGVITATALFIVRFTKNEVRV